MIMHRSFFFKENKENSEESSSVTKPADDNADDPPLEVMSAPEKSAEDSVSATTLSKPTLDTAQSEAETEQIEIAAVPVQENPSVAPGAPAAANNVILEDVEDVEEVPRAPPVEPPIARVIAGLEPGNSNFSKKQNKGGGGGSDTFA